MPAFNRRSFLKALGAAAAAPIAIAKAAKTANIPIEVTLPRVIPERTEVTIPDGCRELGEGRFYDPKTGKIYILFRGKTIHVGTAMSQ